MSDMSEGRRSGDVRLEKIEANQEKMQDDIKEIGKDMVLVKTKIFNGFSHSIASTENKVDYIDKQNDKQHKELGDSIKDLSRKFDKIIWMFLVGAVGIIIKEVVQGML